MKAKIIEMALDWYNNFLTVGAFADYYHIDDERAARIIDIGKRLLNRQHSRG